MLDKTLESPLDCKEIKPIKPKKNQPSIFTGWTYDKVPVLWPPDANTQLIGKDPDAMLGKTEGKKRRAWNYMRWLDSIINSMDMNLNQLQKTVGDRGAQRAAGNGVAKSQI